MSQQLIITNDKDEDYVQFTVEVPDGYKTFQVNCINGTLINQNYLRIGDIIRFSFSNNPLVYDNCPQLTVTDYTSSDGLKQNSGLFDEYLKCKVNLFNIYKVVFIPVYAYYSNDSNRCSFVYNPVDDNQTFDNPVDIVDDYNISSTTQSYCSFTGQFIIGLKSVNNFDDISIVIGSSISNSKTVNSETNLNDTGEIIPVNQTSSRYSYGSAWRYDVSNLIMRHKMTVITGDSFDTDTPLCYYVSDNANNKLYSTSYSNFNNCLFDSTFKPYTTAPDFKAYTFVSPSTFQPLNTECIVTCKQSSGLLKYVIFKNNNDYEELKYDSSLPEYQNRLLPRGYSELGSLLSTSGKYYVYDPTDASAPITDELKSVTHINPNVYYTGCSATIIATTDGVILTKDDLKGATIVFEEMDAQNKKVICCDQRTGYLCTVTTADSSVYNHVEIYFGEVVSNKIVASRNYYIFGSTITLTDSRRYTFICGIYTGVLDSSNSTIVATTGVESSVNSFISSPLQLTEFQTSPEPDKCLPADDDIIIKHVIDATSGDDCLELSMPKLSNTAYYVFKDNDGKVTSIKHVPMTGANGKLIDNVFIPKRSNILLREFSGVQSPVDGLMIVDDILGNQLNDLDVESCSLFLATGHETLNVQPPMSDDYKFKTFNGSVTFDRSRASITRIFSSSNSNNCIGYLNDILSAQLSRYYFVSDYTIFDTFIDLKGGLPLSTTLNQNIYTIDNNSDAIYTGEHAVVLANCGDLVKLIGSEVVTNNCMPGITPEEHLINCHSTTDIDQIISLKDNIEIKPFAYKLFHYYNSGFNNYPSVSDDLSTGYPFMKIDSSYFSSTVSTHSNSIAQSALAPVVAITNESLANEYLISDNEQIIKDSIISSTIFDRNNLVVDCGLISLLPCPRVYRNNNFEQSDLTISTGRIKTLNPIYIQSVSKVVLVNLIYMFDMIYNILMRKYGTLIDIADVYSYLMVFNNSLNDLAVDEWGVLRRFAQIEFDENYYYSLSFDSAFVMNYLCSNRVNEYLSEVDLASSLPVKNNSNNNEEIINNITTNSAETNIQLFSNRYFNFQELISVLSEIVYVQVINYDTSSMLNATNLWSYFGKPTNQNIEDPAYIAITKYVEEFYTYVLNSNSYNLQRTVKCLISRLGEFLEYPKLIFGTTLSFNSSYSVNVQQTNPSTLLNSFRQTYNVLTDTFDETYSEDNSQKNNVSFFGVVFKYHQLSLGWQQMNNESAVTLELKTGVKNFVLHIYDEYGRQFPNIDTSQGFPNNLRLEIEVTN